MTVGFTETQRRRLIELNTSAEDADRVFADEKERDQSFREMENDLIQKGRKDLRYLLNDQRQTLSQTVADDLCKWLILEEGFTRVSTPSIITSQQLDKMTITEDHSLREQVFWVDRKHCLRPMLAPNLYIIMRELRRITREPVRIFELGSCFRKESQGSKHLNEFTMLNLVEIGAGEDGYQMERLEELARHAMNAADIDDYELVKEDSTVYKETLDIEAGGVEIASGSYGPHELDSAWGVFDTWVGLGIGIERAALVRGGYDTIKHVSRSITYLDGVPLKL